MCPGPRTLCPSSLGIPGTALRSLEGLQGRDDGWRALSVQATQVHSSGPGPQGCPSPTPHMFTELRYTACFLGTPVWRMNVCLAPRWGG